MAKASGLFGGGIRLSAQRMLTPEEEAAQQSRPRRSMGEMASGLPSASPLFGGQMMRELPQQKQQLSPPPQVKPPSMWDDISQDPLAFLLSGTNGIAKRRDAVAAEAQRQARIEQANTLGMKGREAALFVDAPEDYYKNYAENMKPTTLSKGQLFLKGDGTKTFNADTGVSEGQAWQTDETGKTLWGQRQATTPEETNAAAVTAETIRNNNLTDKRGWAQIGIDAEKAAGGSKPTPENIGTMRKEWNSQASEFRGVRDAYSRVQASGDGTTPAQQMSMIFAYMKMLDPTSAVREKEYANAENARGVPTAVQNIWNKVVDGQFLAPSQIADFKNQAKSLYQNAETDYGRSFKFYQDQAVGAGMSPDVIQDFRISPENVAPQAPPSATITAPNGQTFTREKSVAVQNFMKSLPKSMQDPQFIAQLDNLLGQSSSPNQQDDVSDLLEKYK